MNNRLRFVTAALAAAVLSPAAGAQVLLSEGFETVAGGVPTTTPGWVNINRTDHPGITYSQGGLWGSAQSGPQTSFIWVNYQSSDDYFSPTETISNWLLTPTISGIQAGATFRFWTRVDHLSTYADRLEVRLSTNGSSTDVGTTSTSVGDFGTLLGTVNPGYTSTGYPATWTEFTFTVSNVDVPTDGRFAFRYYITDTPNNGNLILIDTASVTAPVPEPTGLLAVGAAAAGLSWLVRRVRRTRSAVAAGT